MPGAPNRPPTQGGTPEPPLAVPDPPERKVLRRLAPSRIALSLDIWRGAPSSELILPLERAEAAYGGGDFREATSQLDALAIRFHEPRWPSLPEPFRQLRVSIPAPQPPQWDPDFALAPEEREARRAKRVAETQLTLARASVDWAKVKGLELGDFAAHLDRAQAAVTSGADPPSVYEEIDPIWEAVHERVPLPKAAAAKPPLARAPPAVPDAA